MFENHTATYCADPVEHAMRHADIENQHDECCQERERQIITEFWQKLRHSDYEDAMEMFWWNDAHKTDFRQRALQALLAASDKNPECMEVLNHMAEIWAQQTIEAKHLEIEEMQIALFGRED